MGLEPGMELGPVTVESDVSLRILDSPVMGVSGKSPWILMVQCQNSARDVSVGLLLNSLPSASLVAW